MKGQKILFSSQSDEWATPLDLYKKLNEEFHFKTDPCTTQDNPLGCEVFYTKERNGLEEHWFGNTFINPPHSQIKHWVKSARLRQTDYYDYHKPRHVGTIVMLIPARTDTKWFHNYIYQKPDVAIRFLKGRLKFGSSKNSAPFPSMIVIFR
ncbi:MAG: adenine methyltransferase [Candidatus Brocadia sp. WS118]|nr:MAG: adenine methyltransferase [Candidatus Brocadia sp. WS118]